MFGGGAPPALRGELLLRLEAVLVAHLPRSLDPIAEIDVRDAVLPGIFDLLEDHIGAETARGHVRIVEAVYHRDAVAEPVAERDRHQRRLCNLIARGGILGYPRVAP